MEPIKIIHKNESGKAPQSPSLKIIALGGMEEVGRNSILLEYQNQILIIDLGLQFPDEDMPGVDFIIPNIEYLTNNPQKKVLGVFITHGHYDHIGAIPYLIDKLNYPPIYTGALSRAIILKRQEDFPQLKKLQIEIIKKEKCHPFIVGPFVINPFHINHNIPDSFGLMVKTPAGTIVHTSDFKFDLHPVADYPANLTQIVKLASEGVDLLLSDSTGAETPGYSLSEKTIMENMEKIFSKANGRIILATFASLISRLQQAIWLSEKYNRKVVVEGFGMRNNLTISEKLGYLKIKRGTIINLKDALKLDPKNITILCTGAQGESEAVLMKIMNREHKNLRIQKNDTVVFSSSVIPGNEFAIQNLKDNLTKQGAKIYHYKMLDIHASGHAFEEDLKMMISLVRPKFFMPMQGHYSMLKAHADLGETVGVAKENIVIPANGQIVELSKDKIEVTEKFVPTNYVMVDGLGVGDVGEVVLRDRQTLAQDGIFVIIVLIEGKTGLLYREPEIVSRGFVYMKESKELILETKKLIKDIISKSVQGKTFNESYIRNNLRNDLGLFFFNKTQRRPMILPIITEM